MSRKDIVSLLMILNVDGMQMLFLNVPLRANESHIGVHESILTIMDIFWK